MVRRVVTGHDDAGRSVVADRVVDPVPMGRGPVAFPIWGRADAASLPDAGMAGVMAGAEHQLVGEG